MSWTGGERNLRHVDHEMDHITDDETDGSDEDNLHSSRMDASSYLLEASPRERHRRYHSPAASRYPPAVKYTIQPGSIKGQSGHNAKIDASDPASATTTAAEAAARTNRPVNMRRASDYSSFPSLWGRQRHESERGSMKFTDRRIKRKARAESRSVVDAGVLTGIESTTEYDDNNETISEATTGNSIGRVAAYCTARSYDNLSGLKNHFISLGGTLMECEYNVLLFEITSSRLGTGAQPAMPASSRSLSVDNHDDKSLDHNDDEDSVVEDEIETVDREQGRPAKHDARQVSGDSDSTDDDQHSWGIKANSDAIQQKESSHVKKRSRSYRKPGGTTTCEGDVMGSSTVGVMSRPWYVFISRFGCVVFWDVPKEVQLDLLLGLHPFEVEPLASMELDTFKYVFGRRSFARPNGVFVIGKSTEETDKTWSRIVFSYALAQSVRISAYEEMIEHTISKVTGSARELKHTGKLDSLSRSAVSKVIASTFLLRVNVNVSDISYQPKFLWELEGLEHLHDVVCDYLDIKKRIEILNERIDSVDKLYDVLRDEANIKHGAFLEWIIIWLILLELVVGLLPYIPGLHKK